jgi:hypothetical protein
MTQRDRFAAIMNYQPFDRLPVWCFGTWQADPVALRRRFGRDLRMIGGVNKHVIPRGERAIRASLEPLGGLVALGGYIPLPDHRIPPACSLDQFRRYVDVFRSVFEASPGLRN